MALRQGLIHSSTLKSENRCSQWLNRPKEGGRGDNAHSRGALTHWDSAGSPLTTSFELAFLVCLIPVFLFFFFLTKWEKANRERTSSGHNSEGQKQTLTRTLCPDCPLGSQIISLPLEALGWQQLYRHGALGQKGTLDLPQITLCRLSFSKFLLWGHRHGQGAGLKF